jgi:hypothetical protein
MSTKNSCRPEVLDYVLPTRRLTGTRAEVLNELDEVILALVGLRQMISLQQTPDDRKATAARLRLVTSVTIAALLLTPQPAVSQTTAPSIATEESLQDAGSNVSWQFGGFL